MNIVTYLKTTYYTSTQRSEVSVTTCLHSFIWVECTHHCEQAQAQRTQKQRDKTRARREGKVQEEARTSTLRTLRNKEVSQVKPDLLQRVNSSYLPYAQQHKHKYIIYRTLRPIYKYIYKNGQSTKT